MSIEFVPHDVGSIVIGEYGNRQAFPGYVWICSACGKRSRDRYGSEPISKGFDASCAMNAELIKEEQP
jgi:hypothetical protein